MEFKNATIEDTSTGFPCLIGIEFIFALSEKVSSTVGFLLLQCSSGVVRHPRDLQVSVATRFCRVLIFASSQYLSVICFT